MDGVGRVRASPSGWGATVLLALLAAAGCATDLVREGAVYHHRRLAYRIPVPDGPEGYWERLSVGGADLVFRGARGETMSLAARCDRPVGPPRVMARHLRMGLKEHEVRASGEVAVGGRPGWMEMFDARIEGTTARVKTVTLVARRCTFDWILVAGDGFEDAEAAFDGWWGGFRLGSQAPRRGEGGA